MLDFRQGDSVTEHASFHRSLLSLPPSLSDVMVGIAVAGSPQQHESCVKKCARSHHNNTVALAAAAIITLLPLTAGTYTIQPGSVTNQSSD